MIRLSFGAWAPEEPKKRRKGGAQEFSRLVSLFEAADFFGQVPPPSPGAPMISVRPSYFRSFASAGGCPGGNLTACLAQCAGKGQRCRLGCSMNCGAARSGYYWRPLTVSAGAGMRAGFGGSQKALAAPVASQEGLGQEEKSNWLNWVLVFGGGFVAGVAARALVRPPGTC